MRLANKLVKIIAITTVAASSVAVGMWLHESLMTPVELQSRLNAIEQRTAWYPYPENLEIVVEQTLGAKIPYLVDTVAGYRQPITAKFQLGSAGYRIKGLIEEGAGCLLSYGKSLVQLFSKDNQ